MNRLRCLFLALCAMLACSSTRVGGAGAVLPRKPPPAPDIIPIDGLWNGRFEGMTISFRISEKGRKISNIKFTLSYTALQQGSPYATQVTSEISSVADVSAGQFSIGGVVGTFTSRTTAQGKATVTTHQTSLVWERPGGIGRPMQRAISQESVVSTRWLAGLNGKQGPWQEAFSVESLNERIRRREVAEALDLIRSNPRLTRLKDDRGYSPLYLAAELGDETLVKGLIAAGADPNLKAAQGETPLHAAARGGRLTVVEILIAAGVQKTAQDSRGDTPLTEAARAGQRQVAAWLLARGASVRPYDAVLLDDLARLRVALANDPTIGREKVTAWLYDARSAAVAQVLLDAGADVNSDRQSEGTPLHAAARTGRCEVIDLLIRFGADVNAGNSFVGTPLHAAAKAGKTEAIELLLTKGADINAYMFLAGGSPLDAARRANQKEAVQLLRARGAR